MVAAGGNLGLQEWVPPSDATTICHMSIIPSEELERIKQTMRDWFRVVAP